MKKNKSNKEKSYDARRVAKRAFFHAVCKQKLSSGHCKRCKIFPLLQDTFIKK